MIYKKYNKPNAVGWNGWIETVDGEALAFIGLDGDIVWMKKQKTIKVKTVVE